MKRFRKKIKVEDVTAEAPLEGAEGKVNDEISEEEEREDVSPQEVDSEVEAENEELLAKLGEALDEDDQARAAMEEELETLRAEARENYDKYLRSVAELDNFKKRAQKERSELIRYAGESLARELLEVLDSLELALKAKETEGGDKSEFVRGIELICEQFVSTLGRFSISAQTCVGEKFDPEKQEAMAVVPSAEHEPGVVMEEFKKAYFFRDKLLRAAQVVVSDAMPAASGDSESDDDEGGDEEAQA